MSQRVYFLIYRHYLTCKRKMDWSNPTGGLVVKPSRIVDGHPVADMCLVSDVIGLRYHAGPHEELVVREVFGPKKRRLARRLMNEWERGMHDFVELMEVSH